MPVLAVPVGTLVPYLLERERIAKARAEKALADWDLAGERGEARDATPPKVPRFPPFQLRVLAHRAQTTIRNLMAGRMEASAKFISVDHGSVDDTTLRLGLGPWDEGAVVDADGKPVPFVGARSGTEASEEDLSRLPGEDKAELAEAIRDLYSVRAAEKKS